MVKTYAKMKKSCYQIPLYADTWSYRMESILVRLGESLEGSIGNFKAYRQIKIMSCKDAGLVSLHTFTCTCTFIQISSFYPLISDSKALKGFLSLIVKLHINPSAFSALGK